jgi:hypothetical protein
MAKDKRDFKHEHQPPVKVGDKFICPKCKAEIPVNQPCPTCHLEVDWKKI